MTANNPVRRAKITLLQRHAGVATQFFWTGTGYFYRRDGYGAPIPVSQEERDRFVRGGRTSLLLHIGALLLVLWAALLLSERLNPSGSDVGRAVIVALIVSCVGLVLYRSHAWYADAPARALAHRPAVGPAGEVDVTRWPSYGTIAACVVGVFVMMAMSIRSTMVSIVAVSVAAIVVGLAVAAMKWWFESGFTPKQRQRAIERRAVIRARDQRKSEPGKALLMILFFIVEMVVMLGVFMLVMGVIIEMSGTPWDDPAPLPFIGGMIAAFAAAGLAMWPLEALCKRWTGASAMDMFNGFPF